MNKPLPISLYCVWQWWEKHYQAAQGRPDRIDLDWLDATYLGRQRRLHEWFGDLGVGQAEPALAAGVNDLALWDVDPAVAPGELGAFLRALAALARRHRREPQFGFIPITWEELDWEFPRYHTEEQ